MSSGCVMACSGHVHLLRKWGQLFRCDAIQLSATSAIIKRIRTLTCWPASPPSACVRLWYLQKGRQLLTSRAEFSNKEKVINLVSPRAVGWVMSAKPGAPAVSGWGQIKYLTRIEARFSAAVTCSAYLWSDNHWKTAWAVNYLCSTSD